VHPVAFEIGSFKVYWYGVCVALAFLAGIWTASRRGVRDGLAPAQIVDLGPWLIAGALVGSRLLYVLMHWQEEFAAGSWADVFNVRKGGLVFYGGFFGAALAGVTYVRRRRLPLWKVADALAPSVALGAVFGRTGCLLYGCCYGRETDWPWAIHYPADHETQGRAVHPTPVYDLLLNLALFGVLAWAYRRKRFDGQTAACYLIGYAVLRSVVEFFRGDYRAAQYAAGFATPAHWVSAVVLAAGLLLWWNRSRAGRLAPAKAGAGSESTP
jgi:phosphatidylglycerol:prolipoprotein diacylglycerol transferase